MRTRSLAAALSAALATSALLAPAAPRAAQPSEDCVKLVARNVAETAGSKVTQLQYEVQANRIAGVMMDALGQKLQLGAAWKAGNPHWEEALALFRPDLLASMRASADRELRRMETRLPPLLEPALCRKAMGLLGSKTGAVAARIERGLEEGAMLASFEKQFGVPPETKALSEAAHREAAEAAAPKDGPPDPALAASRAEWRSVSKQLAAALGRIGPGDDAAERKASQEAGAKMMAKNQQAFADIVRRFKAAGGR